MPGVDAPGVDAPTIDADRDGSVPTGSHAHYLFLAAQDESVLARPYSSADGDEATVIDAMIDEDVAGPDPTRWVWNAELDAAVQRITNGGFTNLFLSNALSAQNASNSSNALMFHQFYFSASATRIKEAFLEGGDGGGMYRTFKTWVARNEAKTTGTDPRGLEIRLNGFQSQTAPDLAFFDFRTYGGGGWTPTMDTIDPETTFVMRAGVYTSMWVWVDWVENEWSVWIADSERPEPTVVMDRFAMDGIGAVDPFIIQLNSSQNGGDFPEPVDVAVRDFVYLRDLPSYEAAATLIADPSAREY